MAKKPGDGISRQLLDELIADRGHVSIPAETSIRCRRFTE